MSGVIRKALSGIVAKTTEIKGEPRLFEKVEAELVDGTHVMTVARSWHVCVAREECSACCLAMVQGFKEQGTT